MNPPPPGYETDKVIRLETNLDDLSPELTGAVMDRLFAAGALDVWFTPIQMKKNRPGVMISALCEPPAVGIIPVHPRPCPRYPCDHYGRQYPFCFFRFFHFFVSST